MHIYASMEWAVTWLIISFLVTAIGLGFCVSYLNKGDD
jgi:hypothetical protein